jgi:hypothetical protein
VSWESSLIGDYSADWNNNLILIAGTVWPLNLSLTICLAYSKRLQEASKEQGKEWIDPKNKWIL